MFLLRPEIFPALTSRPPPPSHRSGVLKEYLSAGQRSTQRRNRTCSDSSVYDTERKRKDCTFFFLFTTFVWQLQWQIACQIKIQIKKDDFLAHTDQPEHYNHLSNIMLVSKPATCRKSYFWLQDLKVTSSTFDPLAHSDCSTWTTAHYSMP